MSSFYKLFHKSNNLFKKIEPLDDLQTRIQELEIYIQEITVALSKNKQVYAELKQEYHEAIEKHGRRLNLLFDLESTIKEGVYTGLGKIHYDRLKSRTQETYEYIERLSKDLNDCEKLIQEQENILAEKQHELEEHTSSLAGSYHSNHQLQNDPASLRLRTLG